MTGKARIKEKAGPLLGSKMLNQAQIDAFCHSIEFESFFLEIAYNDSFRKYLTSTIVWKKILGKIAQVKQNYL